MSQSKAPTRVRLSAGQRRESILVAASEVFSGQGYLRGKVSTIAERIGVTEPVVFQNFGTKAALFRAVLDRVASATCDALAAASANGGPVSELLAAVMSPSHVERMHAPGAFGALFAEAAGLTADPDVGEAAQTAIQRVATSLAELLAQGQRDGDIRGDLNPVAGAWWLLSLLSARTFRAAIAADPEAIEAQLATMTLSLLATPPVGTVRTA